MSSSSSPSKPSSLLSSSCSSAFSKTPNEVILIISSHLPTRSLNALLLTSRRFSALLTPLLYKHCLVDGGRAACLNVIRKSNPTALSNLLCNHGVSPNIPDSDPNSPPLLHCAIILRELPTVRLLLEAGADVSKPMAQDLQLETERSLQLVLKYQGQECGTYPSFTPLQTAIAKGQAEILEELLKHGAKRTAMVLDTHQHYRNVNGRRQIVWVRTVPAPQYKLSTLCFAVLTNAPVPVFRILLESGAAAGSTDSHGRSALALAIMTGRDDIVQFLAEQGEDPNALVVAEDVVDDGQNRNVSRGFKKISPLYLAVREQQASALKALLTCGARCCDDRGYSDALELAVITAYRPGIAMLLDAGASVNVGHPESGKSLVHQVILGFKSAMPMPAFPRARGSSADEDKFVIGNRFFALKWLLQKLEADPNVEDKEGMVPLFYAIRDLVGFKEGEVLYVKKERTQREWFVKMLLDAGADVEKCVACLLRMAEEEERETGQQEGIMREIAREAKRGLGDTAEDDVDDDDSSPSHSLRKTPAAKDMLETLLTLQRSLEDKEGDLW